MNPVPDHQGDLPRARRTDPQTSHDAARSVKDPRKSQNEVLEALRSLGGKGTDQEIRYEAFILGYLQSESGLRTRRKELVDMGYVVDSGSRGLTKANRGTVVWQLVDKS